MRRCWSLSQQLCPSVSRKKSKISVAPMSCAHGDMLSTMKTAKGKQVHFADDCGEALECVHVIPQRRFTTSMFYESLEEAYINENGIVRGFLSIANLADGHNLVVLYTENKWKSYKKSPAYRFDEEGYAKIVQKTSQENVNGSPTPRPDGSPVRYAFSFKTSQKKSINVELVVLSSHDGSLDRRHEQRYRLSKTFPSSVTHGHCTIS